MLRLAMFAAHLLVLASADLSPLTSELWKGENSLRFGEAGPVAANSAPSLRELDVDGAEEGSGEIPVIANNQIAAAGEQTGLMSRRGIRVIGRFQVKPTLLSDQPKDEAEGSGEGQPLMDLGDSKEGAGDEQVPAEQNEEEADAELSELEVPILIDDVLVVVEKAAPVKALDAASAAHMYKTMYQGHGQEMINLAKVVPEPKTQPKGLGAPAETEEAEPEETPVAAPAVGDGKSDKALMDKHAAMKAKASPEAEKASPTKPDPHLKPAALEEVEVSEVQGSITTTTLLPSDKPSSAASTVPVNTTVTQTMPVTTTLPATNASASTVSSTASSGAEEWPKMEGKNETTSPLPLSSTSLLPTSTTSSAASTNATPAGMEGETSTRPTQTGNDTTPSDTTASSVPSSVTSSAPSSSTASTNMTATEPTTVPVPSTSPLPTSASPSEPLSSTIASTSAQACEPGPCCALRTDKVFEEAWKIPSRTDPNSLLARPRGAEVYAANTTVIVKIWQCFPLALTGTDGSCVEFKEGGMHLFRCLDGAFRHAFYKEFKIREIACGQCRGRSVLGF